MTDEDKDSWTLDLPLTKSGNSLVVSVPKKVLNACGIGLGSKIRVIIEKKEEE